MTAEEWDSLRSPVGVFDRVLILDEVASTQEEAVRRAGGRPGLAVIARRQVGGRGRQGRPWHDSGGRSLSMSMAVSSRLPAAGLSLAVGLGIIDACESLGVRGLGLKWPNDVVEAESCAPGRKLAGVLIEVSHGLTVVGVGLNVAQRDDDWSAELAGRAVSLRQLGLELTRPAVARAVLEGVSQWLSATPAQIRHRWMEIGTLRERHCVFTVDGRRVEGVVVDLNSAWRLVLHGEDGRRIRIDGAHAHLEQLGDQQRWEVSHGSGGS